MKKFFLSAFVISTFLLYSYYQKVSSSQGATLITQKNTLTVPSTTPTEVPSPTSQLTQVTTQQPTPTTVPTATPIPHTGLKDGNYTGDAADAFYGNIQVQATIQNGKITNIQFLQAPNDRDRSIEINQYADPALAQEAIQTQSADVNVVSGATDSSNAFIESLHSALDKAKA